MRYLLAILVLIIIQACQKDEDLLPGRFVTDQIGQADMVSEGGVDYQMQLYFDLSSGQVKTQNLRDSWDLAFSCDITQPNLFVNPAMSSSIARTGVTDFSTTFDPSNFKFEFERSGRYYHHGWWSGDIDNGQPKQEVYLINLGRDFANQERGFLKVQLIALESDAYLIKVAKLDNSELKEVRLSVEPRYNYQFIKLDKPDEILSLEPPKKEWDLHFTKYMERLFDGSDTLDYSVTGCMINPSNTTAYLDTISTQDSTISYTSLRIEDVDEHQLSDRQNVIGHDWKYFDLDVGTFLVRSNLNYFVRDNSNITYRLHFTGFYNNAGQKGGVSFEYLPL